MTQPSAGWYPDPSGAPGKRYFDGIAWTEHRAPSSPPPPIPQKSKTPKTLLVVIAVIAVFAVAGLAYLGSTRHSETTVAGLNQTVGDGQFTFKVKQVAYSGGYETYLSKPRGQYAVVIIDIANSGDKPQTFFPGNQKLYDAAGRQYQADTMAAIEMNSDGIMDLNPGFSASVKVPFDIPAGTTPTMIELHDSAFSGGAKVKLN